MLISFFIYCFNGFRKVVSTGQDEPPAASALKAALMPIRMTGGGNPRNIPTVRMA
jgi:hypothetical protein